MLTRTVCNLLYRVDSIVGPYVTSKDGLIWGKFSITLGHSSKEIQRLFPPPVSGFINNFEVIRWAPYQLIFSLILAREKEEEEKIGKPYEVKEKWKAIVESGRRREKKVILFTWSSTTATIIGDKTRYWAPPDQLHHTTLT